MVRIIFGGLFIIGGFSGLRTGGILSLLFGLVVGALLIWSGCQAIKRKLKDKEKIVDVRESAVTTFSFKPVGTRYECRINGYCKNRQEALALTGIGALCHLQCYEWEGKPAIMIVSDKLGQDIGVVPAKLVNKVLDLMEQYSTVVEIINKDYFKVQGEEYDGCEVKIHCMNK